MDILNIQVPVTPVIEQLVAALLSQDGVKVDRVSSDATPQNFLTLEQAAEFAGVSYSTMRRWVVCQKRIPCSRLSGDKGQIRIQRSQLEQLLGGSKQRKMKTGRKARGMPVI